MDLTGTDVALLLSTFALSAGAYLAWPSRWNIPAHMAVAFWTVAFFVPIAVVDTPDAFPASTVNRFSSVLVIGAVAYVAGIILAVVVFAPMHATGIFARIAAWESIDEDRLARRTLAVALTSVLLLATAIVVMGFVPMFAPDPFAAKFFRGSYGAAYRPVAPLYRGASGLLAVFIPLILVYGLARPRKLKWRLAFLMALGLMLVTLQRGPAVTGVLLAVGAWLIQRRRTGIFIALVIFTYFVGALSYVALDWLGLITYETTPGVTIWNSVAASVPDIADNMYFLERWEHAGEPLTQGRTFFGGVVPGNYSWNPGVWTLTLGQAGIDISTISSGGLRLLLPVWGLVSFNGIGIIVVSFASGMLAGVLTRSVGLAMDSNPSFVGRIWCLVLYGVWWNTIVEFTTVGYLTVIQLVVLYWACSGFRPGRGQSGRRQPLART